MQELSENIVSAVKEIKSAIIRAQSRVAANANAEMLSLYFGIGRYVSYRTKTEKWGTGVIDAISSQLQREMPGLHGFSSQSIRRMRQFFETWCESAIWQTPVAESAGIAEATAILPPLAAKLEDSVICSPAVSKLGMVTAAEFMSLSFSHHMTIISQTDVLEERLFYIREAAQNHWGRDRLSESIKRALPPIDELRRQLAITGDAPKESEENT